MKKLFVLFFCITSISADAQWALYNLITFDSGDVLYPIAINIDTMHYHHNIWQIGKPNKTFFTSAHSVPNAIMTDTLYPFPANDTSFFILKVPSTHLFSNLGIVELFYELNIDSNALARVEISEDNGIRWVNVKDSLPSNYFWGAGGRPNLSVSTSTWGLFSMSRCVTCPNVTDTVLFRFTFISDSVYSGKDGWIIDDIEIQYLREGVVSPIQDNNLISFYPNPSKGNIYIHSKKPISDNALISVYNVLGQEVYTNDKILSNSNINLQLPAGFYVLKYNDSKEQFSQQIIIIN